MVSMSDEEVGMRCSDSVGGRAGAKVCVSTMHSYHGGLCSFPASPLVRGATGSGFAVPGRGAVREGPVRTPWASRRMEWSRWSCEVMNGAEWRSPVHRVISTQSRALFRRVRRWDS